MGVSDPSENIKKCSKNFTGSTPDERTPLLADGRPSGQKRALSDPEFGTCQSPNEEPSSTTNAPKDITGVISILLLGNYSRRILCFIQSFKQCADAGRQVFSLRMQMYPLF
jgi:hypothetical protein